MGGTFDDLEPIAEEMAFPQATDTMGLNLQDQSVATAVVGSDKHVKTKKIKYSKDVSRGSVKTAASKSSPAIAATNNCGVPKKHTLSTKSAMKRPASSKRKRASASLLMIIKSLLVLSMCLLGLRLFLFAVMDKYAQLHDIADADLKVARGLMDKEDLLQYRTCRIVNTKLARRPYETHEDCIVRSVNLASYQFVPLDWTAYPDIVEKVTDWTNAECERIMFTPMVLTPHDEVFAAWYRVKEEIARSAQTLKTLIKKTMAIAKARFAALITVSPHLTLDVVAGRPIEKPVIPSEKRKASLHLPKHFKMVGCNGSSTCKLVHTHFISEPDNRTILSEPGIPILQAKIDSLSSTISVFRSISDVLAWMNAVLGTTHSLLLAIHSFMPHDFDGSSSIGNVPIGIWYFLDVMLILLNVVIHYEFAPKPRFMFPTGVLAVPTLILWFLPGIVETNIEMFVLGVMGLLSLSSLRSPVVVVAEPVHLAPMTSPPRTRRSKKSFAEDLGGVIARMQQQNATHKVDDTPAPFEDIELDSPACSDWEVVGKQ